jgi:hypothetical protein
MMLINKGGVMATLVKQETSQRIEYTITADNGLVYKVFLPKRNSFQLQFDAPWPISGCSGWQEYATLIEAGNTII